MGKIIGSLTGSNSAKKAANAQARALEEQTRQALENIRAILAEANASVGEIVKATVHLRDHDSFGGFNEAYKKFFDEYAPGVPLPVRTTVQSGIGEMLVEIDVIAVKTR